MYSNRTLCTRILAASLIISGSACYAAEDGKPDSRSITVKPHERLCMVHCIDPTTTCDESKKVLAVLQKLITSYANGDLKDYRTYLDEKCTMFDENTKEMIVGREAVLNRMKSDFTEQAPGGSRPLISLTIDQPYVKVTSPDECVVTFIATKEIGGVHPVKEQANITDVFVKRDGEWRKMHFQAHWTVKADK